jgi:hypothetical protein
LSAKKSVEKEQDIKVESKEQLVKLIDVALEKKRLDYSRLNEDWQKSLEGKKQIQEIAHHYHIFRDLFSSPSQTPINDPVPKVTIAPFKPIPDHIMTEDLYQEWYPGVVRYKDLPPRQIYHFTPHVPIHVEFCVPEKLIQEWEDKEVDAKIDGKEKAVDPNSLITSPVYRGNIVTPLYAAAKPSAVIDTRTEKSYLGKESIEVNNIKLLKEKDNKNLYSLCLYNLDTILGDDKPVCHWMVSNIGSEFEEESVSFMPVFGIRGLGFHRYVFLLLQHSKPLDNLKKITNFSFTERQVDPLAIIKEHECTPVGLSWFQSNFDNYSQEVMHSTLNIRSPNYEYIEEVEVPHKQVKHPFGAPFNHYLDHYRDPKEINRYTLLERLKSLNPFDYSKQFEKDPLPNAYLDEIRDIEPSWMQNIVWKKRNRVGPYRYLRPHSAKIPLNNNVDLDNPIFPAPENVVVPNKYPPNVRRWKPLRDTKWATPPNEWPIYSVNHPNLKSELEETKTEDK